MAQKRILILGAGLSGLSTAWHLQKNGRECRIFEREAEVGGLCRSKHVNGFTFDFDGHLLHFKHPYTFRMIKALLGDNLAEHKRSAWIYSRGRHSRYPFQANLYGLPPKIIEECLFNFIKTHRNNGSTSGSDGINFEDWIFRTFGGGIARHFMVPYNAKFWTVPLKQLTCEWLDGFIPVPSLEQIIEGTIEDSLRQYGYNARFWYPREGGIRQVPVEIAKQVVNIRTGCGAEKIDLKKKLVKFSDGESAEFDCLISTIPLPELSRLSVNMPDRVRGLFKKLRWNSIYNLNLGIERKDPYHRHWVYFPGSEVCFFRVGFPHNFSSSSVYPGGSSLYAEVSYSDDKPIKKNKITGLIKEDLKKAGIIKADKEICAEDTNDIQYGYPIYDINYNRARKQILQYLESNNVLSCGRYGSWRYMSMEDVILDGRLTAEKVSRGR